jgi:hypothetical protein
MSEAILYVAGVVLTKKYTSLAPSFIFVIAIHVCLHKYIYMDGWMDGTLAKPDIG